MSSSSPAAMEALERDLASSPYTLVRYLARGGMGEVVVVEHRELARQSVMKLLRTNLKGQEDLAERLRVEARLMAKLSHPNLVGILDFGRTASGRPYLVTELLEGQPLQELLASRGGSLPVAEALGLASQVLAGLEPVHAAGFIHRDIKPANLFVTPGVPPASATLKILDFGIAKALSEKDRQALGLVKPTTDGTAVGTPSTMSPEQAAARPVDARTDIYALGVVLFRMICGRSPFVGEAQEVLLAHITEPPPAPSTLAAQAVDPAIDALVLRALAKAPGERFQSAREMREAIDRILGRPATPTPAPSMASPAPPLAGASPAETTSPDAAGATRYAAPGADDPTTRQMAAPDPRSEPALAVSKATVRLLESPPPMDARVVRQVPKDTVRLLEAPLQIDPPRAQRRVSASPAPPPSAVSRWWPILVAVALAMLVIAVGLWAGGR